MKNIFALFALGFALLAVSTLTWETPAGDAPKPFAKFKMVELPEKLGVGYAVLLVDVNGDGKKDIVVVDQTRVIWFENPTWKMHTIIKGMTKPDNVCIDAYDIDGDGQIDFALGADWKPFNTNSGGTLQWLKRGKDIDDPWTVYPIGSEPTLHRIRFADIDGKGKKDLIVVPLMGRGATKEKNWLDGDPVDVIAYRVPKNPTKEVSWVSDGLIKSKLHVAHNFQPIPSGKGTSESLLVASYEGVSLVSDINGWHATKIAAGNQENPNGSRGASEVKQGKLKNGKKFIATIEPWHGNQVVVYTEPADKEKLWDRHVIDEQLRWGHAVSVADLDGDGSDELIVGVRDEPSKGDKFTESRGVRIYKATDDIGAKWQRQIIDNGGIAVEDLAVADLNGDGRPDIVAVGRQTHNIRIYWNEGKK
jgi:FG-GAP-like repeat/FG-GAP repeat